MALDLVAELENLVDAFAREAIEYAICGGLALTILGHPRTTMDIDVLVRREELARAMTVARQLGFDVPREMQRVSKLDPGTGRLLSLDLIVVETDLEGVWADWLVLPLRARNMSVVSRAGLATMKRMAGRPQDLADLAVLEGTADDDTEEG